MPSESEKPGSTLRDARLRFRAAAVALTGGEAGWPEGQLPSVVELDDMMWECCWQ